MLTKSPRRILQCLTYWRSLETRKAWKRTRVLHFKKNIPARSLDTLLASNWLPQAPRKPRSHPRKLSWGALRACPSWLLVAKSTSKAFLVWPRDFQKPISGPQNNSTAVPKLYQFPFLRKTLVTFRCFQVKKVIAQSVMAKDVYLWRTSPWHLASSYSGCSVR